MVVINLGELMYVISGTEILFQLIDVVSQKMNGESFL